MKRRIKWLLMGVGVMYATQVVILLAIQYTMPEWNRGHPLAFLLAPLTESPTV